ncbi:DALR anticodon-binding domain-containing protein [Kitasatospora sp. NPDC098663]|uniref:DALR anticodon-binding domain-containing protein n=1 Tax=Kitasatospora sp. NPDC098663 TaxID=3364096 RepID=UPI0038053ACB
MRIAHVTDTRQKCQRGHTAIRRWFSRGSADFRDPLSQETCSDGARIGSTRPAPLGLTKALTDFYGSCPVLKAETPAHRTNRVALCRLTAETLARDLDLLGLQAPDLM